METAVDLTIRDAEAEDADAVQAIYAHHVLNGTASYDFEPPSAEYMRAKIRSVRGRAGRF